MKKCVFAFLFIVLLGILTVCGVKYQGSTTALAASSLQPVAYVPINITNNQRIATPNPFQVMIQVNSTEYNSTYEPADLSNIAFAYPNGTLIPSWLESGNSNSSTDTVYWLKINSIPAKSNMTIYMNFYPITDSVLNNTTTGEAPSISSTYGEYDNGQNVFTVYGDFMNTYDGWNASQYLGNLVPPKSPNGIEMLDNGNGEGTYIVSPSLLPPSPTIVEEGWSYIPSTYTCGEANAISMFGVPLHGSSPALIPSEASDLPVLNRSVSVIYDYDSAYTHINDYIRNSQIGSSSFTGSGNFNVTSFLAVNGTWAWTGYDNTYMNLNEYSWTNPVTSAGGASSNPFSNSALIISASTTPANQLFPPRSTQYIRWVIGRTMPPNNVEPSIAIGKLTLIIPEYASIIILPAFIMATLLAVAICRRKRLQLT